MDNKFLIAFLVATPQKHLANIPGSFRNHLYHTGQEVFETAANERIVRSKGLLQEVHMETVQHNGVELTQYTVRHLDPSNGKVFHETYTLRIFDRKKPHGDVLNISQSAFSKNRKRNTNRIICHLTY